MNAERTAWLLAMILSGMGVSASGARAADAEGAAESAAPVVQAAETVMPPPSPASDDERAREQQRQTIRAKLNGTTWAVQLSPDAGGKKEQDTLTFTDRTVESKRLSKAGFGTSNYSVRIDGDIGIWETMQTKEGEMAFWRGEMYGEKMAGALSQQPKEGVPQNFSFGATKSSSGAPPAQQPEAAVTAPPAEMPKVEMPKAEMPKVEAPAQTPAPAKSKKRWGLF